MNRSAVQMLAEVAITAVRENAHKIAAVACKRKLFGNCQCRAGGKSSEDTFLSKFPRAVDGLCIANLYHLLHKRHFYGIIRRRHLCQKCDSVLR